MRNPFRTPTRALGLGFLACLLIGGAVGAAHSGAFGGLAFTLPASRVGDEVVYAPIPEEGTPTSWWTTRVAGINPTVDAHGRAWEALVLESNHTTYAEAPSDGFAFPSFPDDSSLPRCLGAQRWSTPDKGLEPGTEGYVQLDGSVSTDRVELTHRSFVRSDSPEGPDAWCSWFGEGSPNPSLGLRYQGRTLRLGDVLYEANTQDGREYSRHLEWVAKQGKVDGSPALAVEIRTAVGYIVDDAVINGQTHEEYLVEGESVRTLWFVAAHPYPVLDEETILEGGEELQPAQRSALVAFRPGAGEPVPWAPGPIAPRPSATPEIQRSGGVPTTGPGAYPVAQAWSDLRAQPSFGSWAAGRPATLVGFAYAGDAGWRLVAAAEDDVFAALVGPASDGTPMVSETRTGTSTQWERSTWGDTSISLAAAEERWRLFASEDHRACPVTTVEWGLLYGSTTSAPGWAGFVPDPTPPSDRRSTDPRLRIGHIGGACEGASILVLDPATGAADRLYESRHDHVAANAPPEEFNYVAVHDVAPAGFRVPDVTVVAVAGGAAFATFLVLYFLPTLKFLAARAVALVPGFSRLRAPDVLDNKVRDALLEEIKKDPGASATELRTRVQVGWGTLVYHLSVLERMRIVSSVSDGRHRRFFPAGAVDWSKQGQLALLKNEKARRVYDLVLEEPGNFQEALAERLGLSRTAAMWHLGRLEEAGLVARIREGRRVLYFPNAPGQFQSARDERDAVEVA